LYLIHDPGAVPPSMRLLKLLALPVFFLFYFILPTPASTADFTGPVVSVLDGDTIEVLHNNKAERIRLSGIDCPGKGQAW
jgi:micrococcal nuclease